MEEVTWVVVVMLVEVSGGSKISGGGRDNADIDILVL